MAAVETPTRRPYLGSCHCGKIRYIAFLTLPAKPPYVWADKSATTPPQMIRRCNCTWCHKTSYLHVRLANPPNDFVLLSPLDPFKELGNYNIREHSGSVSYNLLCPTCGVRCFGTGGPSGKELGSIVERDLAADGVDITRASIDGDGKSVKVWMPNPDGWQEEVTHWLRVNGTSLEPDQEGLNLREWTEKKWVQYVNWLDEVEGCSYEKPYHGGIY